MRKGFIFDLNKCVGCEACVVACQIENHRVQNGSWRSISTYNEFKHPALPLFHFSLACNHCDEPLCMTGCPANAFSIDPVHRTVDHHQENCIGCRYCTWTCPYDAPKYVTANGTIEKCTLCKERIEGGRRPNCVNLCPTGALDYDTVETKGSLDVPGFTDRGMWPAIRFIPLRKKERPSSASPSLSKKEKELFESTRSVRQQKSTLGTEWPLVIFTVLAAFLVAVAAASLTGISSFDPAAFGALSLAGMAVSALHLGKPLKAWRALLNVRASWLSREILFFLLFAATFELGSLMTDQIPLEIVSVLFGLATLVSIDMVYVTVGQRFNSIERGGSVVLTGGLIFAVVAQIPLLIITIILLNGVLYGKGLLTARRSVPRMIASSVRIAAGFVVPLLLISTSGSPWLLMMSVLTGECINRAEFYLDLDIVTPQKQIERDLARTLKLTTAEQS